MSINEIIVYLMVVFMALGAVDRILGNRFGLGEKFEEGIMAMGSLALAMIGIICLAPVLANLLRPVVVPLYQALGADPAMFAGTLLANDMGGAPLAQELALPVVVHDREAHGDTVEFLRKYQPRGVVHCFSGSWETAREILGLGMYIGLGGVVTFKNARHAVEVAQNIPLDRLLLETDAPYMAPVPHRGKRNDSSLIPLVAEKIGELRGLEAQAVLDITAENAARLFGLG